MTTAPDYGVAPASNDLGGDQEINSTFLSKVLCFMCLPCTLCCSITVIGETDQLVIQEWGKYTGILKTPGFHWINCWGTTITRISTKTTNVDIGVAKVADKNGSPVVVSAIIAYKFVDPKAATFGVSNTADFIKIQALAVIKNIVSRYPYETKHPNEASLKNETAQISKELVDLLQSKVANCGAQILSFEFNELSYAPEIASGMLVRQQAEATIAARATIVQGAVDIAMGAVSELEKKGLKISDEDKAKMVSNLLVVLCAEQHAQPTVSLN